VTRYHLAAITGASSGIGEALCFLLADKGCNLLISGRDRERLEIVAKRVRSKVSVEIVPADLGEKDQRERWVKALYHHAPDLVINNAGFGLLGDALDHETQAQVEILRIDAEAVLELTLEAARSLKGTSCSGTIVNVASAAAFQPFPRFAVYAAAKAFVKNFSEAFHEEMKPYGIKVLVACPGWVDTPFRHRAAQGISPTKPSKYSMTAEYAAEQIWWQITKGKVVHTFDWRYRLAVWFGHYLLPKAVVSKILKSRIKHRLRLKV